MDVARTNPVGEGRGSPREPAPNPTLPRPAADILGPNAAVQAPQNGGPTPTSRTEGRQDRDREASTEPEKKHRNEAAGAVLAAIRRRAEVNIATDLRIEVDLRHEEPRFLVVSRENGEVLRQISLEETKRILEEVPEAKGLLLDDRG